MKRAFKATAAVLVAAFLLGPRPKVDTNIPRVTLPKDLAATIEEGEARFDDLRPGCAKKIAWAGSAGEKTPISVVYLHGFSATRQETAPLVERLADALGADLLLVPAMVQLGWLRFPRKEGAV